MTRDPEIERQIEKDDIFHFFFHHGLFEYLFHIQDFIDKIDSLIQEKYTTCKQNDEENPQPAFTDKVQFGSVFPHILWKASFLHLYAFTEGSLIEICNNFEKFFELPLKLNEINGKGIKQCEHYLKKVLKIDFPSKTKEWKSIEDFSKIRNLFMHSDGVFKEDNIMIINLIKKYNGIQYSRYVNNLNLLFIEKNFVCDVLNTIRTFFYLLHHELNKLK